jgi:nitric oxide reductase large subunit
MTVSPLWLQGSILTFIVWFSLERFSAIRIKQDYAPIPERIADEVGNLLLTRQQILDGQEPFLKYGLMENWPARVGTGLSSEPGPTDSAAVAADDDPGGLHA